MCNRVDITDLTCKYSPDKYEKLPAHIKSLIWNTRKTRDCKREREEEPNDNSCRNVSQVEKSDEEKNEKTSNENENKESEKGARTGRRFSSNAYNRNKA